MWLKAQTFCGVGSTGIVGLDLVGMLRQDR